jgi:hypothetical protein
VAVIATRDPEFPVGLLLVGLVFTGPLALAGLRAGRSVRLTANELIIRWPIGGRRIARGDVASAQFGLYGLHIRLRNGGTALAPLAPKWRSMMLSRSGQPGADSAAYQITRWAQSQPPSEG